MDACRVPEPFYNMFHNSFGWSWWGEARLPEITPLVSGSARRLGRPAHTRSAYLRAIATLRGRELGAGAVVAMLLQRLHILMRY